MYDSLAFGYRDYSWSRKFYLDTIDNIVRRYIKPDCFVIDFGSGDGVRIKNITSGATSNLCLVENSHNMLMKISEAYPDAVVLNQDFSGINFNTNYDYDVATCLWNVLGHLGDKQQILTGLMNIKKSLKPNGIVILDVNNRHNVSQYGWKAIRNIIKDMFSYKFENGDINFNISLGNKNIPSNVHIFNKHEIEKLLKESGFGIKHRFYVNYANGKIKRFPLFGQICYVLTVKE